METAFFIMVLGALIYLAITLRRRRPATKTDQKLVPGRIAFEGYELVSSVNNPSEAQLFHSLVAYAGQSGCHVLVKPRLEDIIKVRRNITGKDKSSLRGRIRSRHLDFVIIDGMGQPLAAVELDGPSHNSKSAQAADHFKNSLAHSVGLPLHRVLTSENPHVAAYDIFTVLYNARQVA